MPHTKSLRAIGQSLESLGIVAFVMERDGRSYIVRSEDLPKLSEWERRTSLSEKVWESRAPSGREVRLLTADGSLRYEPSYVAWLDAQGRKKRRRRVSAQATGSMKFSQLMRTLGRQIDRLDPHGFTLIWKKDAVTINYDLGNGKKITEVLTIEKLRELTVRMRIRRAPRR